MTSPSRTAAVPAPGLVAVGGPQIVFILGQQRVGHSRIVSPRGRGKERKRMANYLIYGSNGYTGALIAREAAARGQRPVLAGRSADAVEALARQLGLEARVFGLDDPAALSAGLDGMAAVLHCAGPFAHTARPMAEA